MKTTRTGIWVALLLEILILVALTSRIGGEPYFQSTFLNYSNISQVLRAVSFIAIMAVGQAVVIISGGIDLAAGSILGLAGVVTALALNENLPVSISILVGLAVGLVAGGGSGLLVTKAKLPPFIATLGMLSVARGVAYAITGGETIRNLPKNFLFIGQGELVGVPIPVWVMLIFAVVIAYFLSATMWGRYAYAIGGNEEAARLSGVAVNWMKLLFYLMAGLSAAVAGVLYVARFGVGQSTAGLGYELDVIAAAVIGGVSLSGGRGTITGVILGSILMGVLRNGLVLLNVSAYWQQVAIGAVIILAVILDRRSKA
ncbi:MAG: ABC transporter permease [Bacteroidota bacterium]